MSKQKQKQNAGGNKRTAPKNGDKNWNVKCENCGQLPTVHPLGLCGPCCFGEADTAGGNW